MTEPIIGQQNDEGKLIFILALVNPENPNQFANIAFGVAFKTTWIDDNSVEMCWICLRQIQQNNGTVMIQTPPPAFKWLMAKEHFIGMQAFQKDDYMEPGHLYRLIWIRLPEDEQGVAPGEVGRIIKPNSSLLFPGK